MKTKLTTKYQTIATVGFTAGVAHGIDENRSAHGGVCHLQARLNNRGEILGRKVNSNGRHIEIGRSFLTTADELSHWESMSR